MIEVKVSKVIDHEERLRLVASALAGSVLAGLILFVASLIAFSNLDGVDILLLTIVYILSKLAITLLSALLSHSDKSYSDDNLNKNTYCISGFIECRNSLITNIIADILIGILIYNLYMI